MYRSNRPHYYGALALISAGILSLAGCASSFEPAAPDDKNSAHTALQERTPQGSNPYEAGAERSWNIELPDAPSFIGYLEDKKLLITATDGITGIKDPHVDAYSLVGGDNPQLLQKWSTSLQQTHMITAFAVGEQSVSVNTTSATGQKDLISFDIVSGDIRGQWSRDNGSDADVPELVGAYSEGMGVLKPSSTRLTAALMDPSGAFTQSRDHLYDSATLADRMLGKNLVDTAIPADRQAGDDLTSAGEAASAGSKESQDLQSTLYFTFPALAIIEGSECWAVSDGYVCVAAEENADTLVVDSEKPSDSDRIGENSDSADAEEGFAEKNNEDEASQKEQGSEAAILVREYDQSGHRVRETSVGEESVAANVTIASMDPGTDARTLGDALAKAYEGKKQVGRVPAIFHDGQWIERSAWKVPQGFRASDAQPISGQAPLCRLPSGAIINIQTGEALTADGALGYVGRADASSMIFEYAQGVLYYLAPRENQE